MCTGYSFTCFLPFFLVSGATAWTLAIFGIRFSLPGADPPSFFSDLLVSGFSAAYFGCFFALSTCLSHTSVGAGPHCSFLESFALDSSLQI